MHWAIWVGLASVALYQLFCRFQHEQTLPYRYGSFALVRIGEKARWYVDGQDYMSAVADAINSAEKEILITDWRLSPYIFMKRNHTGYDDNFNFLFKHSTGP